MTLSLITLAMTSLSHGSQNVAAVLKKQALIPRVKGLTSVGYAMYLNGQSF